MPGWPRSSLLVWMRHSRLTVGDYGKSSAPVIVKCGEGDLLVKEEMPIVLRIPAFRSLVREEGDCLTQSKACISLDGSMLQLFEGMQSLPFPKMEEMPRDVARSLGQMYEENLSTLRDRLSCYYTPDDAVERLLEKVDRLYEENYQIYDPVCGSSSLLFSRHMRSRGAGEYLAYSWMLRQVKPLSAIASWLTNALRSHEIVNKGRVTAIVRNLLVTELPQLIPADIERLYIDGHKSIGEIRALAPILRERYPHLSFEFPPADGAQLSQLLMFSEAEQQYVDLRRYRPDFSFGQPRFMSIESELNSQAERKEDLARLDRDLVPYRYFISAEHSANSIPRHIRNIVDAQRGSIWPMFGAILHLPKVKNESWIRSQDCGVVEWATLSGVIVVRSPPGLADLLVCRQRGGTATRRKKR